MIYTTHSNSFLGSDSSYATAKRFGNWDWQQMTFSFDILIVFVVKASYSNHTLTYQTSFFVPSMQVAPSYSLF